MRNPSTLIFGLALSVAGAAPQAAGAIETVSSLVIVSLDQARIVKVPERTQTLVIGNPLIADVTLLKTNGTMVITGKGFGETNLIALDAQGTPVAESMIRVNGENRNVVVQRGMERESYSCAPRCQPTVTLGDSAKYANDIAGVIKSRDSSSKGK